MATSQEGFRGHGQELGHRFMCQMNSDTEDMSRDSQLWTQTRTKII